MTKKNNKGFSLIEVIIAVAVFAILIVPLTSQLISAVNINKKSTKKQYAIDKAEQIMESFKTADISSSAISIPDGNSTGSYNFTCTSETTKTTDNEIAGIKKVNYTVKTYTCNDISIGGNYAKYGCTVTVSDLAQQVAALGYIWDPETGDAKVHKDIDGKPIKGDYIKIASSVGTVRNLDNKQVAIIAGATYTGDTGTADGNNLDNQASSYFMDEKTDLLKQYTTAYNQMLTVSKEAYWGNDTFAKTTTIKIFKTAEGMYRVQCLVSYKDSTKVGNIRTEYENGVNNVYEPASVNGNGVVYQNDYKTLPPVYLLYVPATSNGDYVSRDYINIDTSALSDTDNAKIYIFQTASDIDEKYMDIINQTLQNGDASKSVEDLIYKNASSTSSASSVRVRVNYEAAGKTLVNPADGAKIDTMSKKTKVYANFSTDDANSTVSVKKTKDDKSDDTYMYDLTVEMEQTDNHDKTTISGTRGN